MITNNYTLQGELRLVVTDTVGNTISDTTVKNLITSAGKELIANRLKADTEPAIGWCAVGTDGTAADAGDTTLAAEVARVAVTSATVTANSVAFVSTFPAGTGTGTLLEAGLFNDNSAGTLFSRTASINVVKGATDTLTITWTITAS